MTVTAERVSHGPLRVCSRNPRYFADPSDRPVYLAGAHTWSNLQEFESDSHFDYDAYLTWLEKLGLNFMRMWVWECGYGAAEIHGWSGDKFMPEPTMYERTGPGEAFDRKPKFDVTKLNEGFFARLRERVKKANDRGIYATIQFFLGYELEKRDRKINPWDAHPYNKTNNINGIDGDPDGTSNGYKIQTLEIPAITKLQEEYVRKVVDTVNDLDNVMYEVSPESDATSTGWQYHIIDYVHKYERKNGKQHPVGMSYQDSYGKMGTNADLFHSPAEYISPSQMAEGHCNYCYNPPPADGKKVVILDTGHLWGIGGDSEWVWKSFLRGHNPVFMDPYDSGFMDPNDSGLINVGKVDMDWEPVRKALGQTRTFAERIDLANMVPHPELALGTEARRGGGYCLANPGSEYLVYYSPEIAKRMLIDLTHCKGRLSVEWFNPDTGNSIQAESIEGGEKKVFVSAFTNSAVLYLRRET